MEYSYQPKSREVRTARARLSGINASWKDLCEVCRNIRGKDTDYAIEFLQDALDGKKAIHFARHCARKGHRKELGGRKGGWPVKSIGKVLAVLRSAHANANRLGLSATKVAHIVSNKVDSFPRMSPKGRRVRHDYETAFVEIVLAERQQRTDAKKGANAAAIGKKKEEAKTESQEKKAEMPSIDRHRPVEERKMGAIRPSEQRI